MHEQSYDAKEVEKAPAIASVVVLVSIIPKNCFVLIQDDGGPPRALKCDMRLIPSCGESTIVEIQIESFQGRIIGGCCSGPSPILRSRRRGLWGTCTS